MGFWTRLLFASTSPSLRRFVHDRVLPAHLALNLRRAMGLLPKTGPGIERLNGRLWGGFSEDALLELRQLVGADEAPSELRAAAHLSLAAYYASAESYGPALEHARGAAGSSLPDVRFGRQVLLEADCLAVLGRRGEARCLLQEAIDRAPFDNHLRLAFANTWVSFDEPTDVVGDDMRLRELNRIYETAGLTRLHKRDTERPLSLDNLTATSVLSGSGPLVSILMPAYAAESTLAFAVRGVVEQTWQDWELLVVDDQSPDGTFDLAQSLARTDPRIRAFRTQENGGAYVARNFALERARGELVTVHDADDWSHPQKLQLQVERLQTSRALGTSSDWVRCFRHLYFRGNTPPSSSWITWNVSSLLARTEQVRRMGGWDAVRVGADSELKRRLEHRQPSGAVLHTQSGIPLSLGLERAASLTRVGATHVATARHGVRKTYHDASRHWLARQVAALPSIGAGAVRSFPAPLPLLPARGRASLDLLVVGELLEDSPDFGALLHVLRTARGEGLQLGVLHWPEQRRTCQEAPSAEILSLAAKGDVYVVSPGEDLTVFAAVATTPAALSCKMDRPPTAGVSVGALWVQTAAPDQPRSPDHTEAERAFASAFEVEPTWLAGHEALGAWLQELAHRHGGAAT